MDIQPIPQVDADEIVRILITYYPDATQARLMVLARAEGMPLRQAIDTVRCYTGSALSIRSQRCVEYNAVRCARCA